MIEQDGSAGVADAVTSRRAILAGGGGLCLVMLLAACGSDDKTETPTGNGQQNPTTTEPADEPTDEPGDDADVLAKVSEVPTGGGKLVGSILVVKLADNTIKAYDAHCTHQGYLVDEPVNGVIICANHGSKFKATDGSVAGPPATRALKTVDVKVEGDNIIRV